jgi:hypothetical protein
MADCGMYHIQHREVGKFLKNMAESMHKERFRACFVYMVFQMCTAKSLFLTFHSFKSIFSPDIK